MDKRSVTSSWTALRNRGFRIIFLASVVSGTCASAHGSAATWALLLSMMSTFSSPPFFLFTLPAGALADMMDRAKLVKIVHVWLAVSAAGLAIFGWSHLLNGNLVLLSVFLIGAGFAFNAPAFSGVTAVLVAVAVLILVLLLTFQLLSSPLINRFYRKDQLRTWNGHSLVTGFRSYATAQGWAGPYDKRLSAGRSSSTRAGQFRERASAILRRHIIQGLCRPQSAR
jgi:hypothetical protein